MVAAKFVAALFFAKAFDIINADVADEECQLLQIQKHVYHSMEQPQNLPKLNDIEGANASLAPVEALLATRSSSCPGADLGSPLDNFARVPGVLTYAAALKKLDVTAVIAAIEDLLTKSNDCWPADCGHYGPFFIRLAWHCSGTYRMGDGRGGCGGGRQRFEPERSWADNANLDHARALLAPIKTKFGDGLSWGDLFTLAGTTAIKSMGGPIVKVCTGRMDDPDGTSSLDLGPNEYQEKVAPCENDGSCKSPLGATTRGLIYVNPEGPVEENENGEKVPSASPKKSAPDIRDAFSRMGMDDVETVALIGGGHAFGKTHGACKRAHGELCGSGKGEDTFTSGFEGPWTTTPNQWSNEFFRFLLEYEWEKVEGPGGHYQYQVKDASKENTKLMRLVSDMALLEDEQYLKIVKRFARNQDALDKVFAQAWLKLTTNGGMWSDAGSCERMRKDDSGQEPTK